MTRFLLVLLTTILISSCNHDRTSRLQSVNKGINGISLIKYTITNTYPHSIESYTEGLIFHDNKLFESTGSPENYPNTKSVIGIVNLKTGKIDVKVEIDRNKYFGEGILFFKNKLYQLTYKNQLGFIYNSDDFKQIGSFSYINKEGWGMTTDGNSIIMSDGTNFITYWDPDSLKEIKKINITYNGSSALYANELEFINGFIYANIWTTNYIAKIDPSNGKIVGLIDLTTLFLKARKENPQSEATNGIAYDSKRNRVFVTGKFWPFIFEIKFQDLKNTAANKEDFMWHVVPSMKSHVALNPCTLPYSMHLPSLFLFHKQPYFWPGLYFLGNILVLFLHSHLFLISQKAGFTRFQILF